MKSEKNNIVKRKSDSIDALIGQSIKKIRLLKGLTREQASECLSITSQQFQKYEHGTNRITASALYKLATFFSVSIEDFFEALALQPLYTNDPSLSPNQWSLSDIQENYSVETQKIKEQDKEKDRKKLLEYFDMIHDYKVKLHIIKIVESLALSKINA